MDEELLWKTLGGTGGLGGLVLLLRIVYIQWVKQNPAIAQSEASSDLYKLLKDELRDLKIERNLLRKQITLLEHLCVKNGINVHECYVAAGVYEEDDDVPQTNKETK